MRGPPRKPTRLKLLEGNKGHQTKKVLNLGPEWPEIFGKCPSDLKGAARNLWKKLAVRLEEKKLSSEVYRPALEGLCRAYQKATAAERVLDREGMTMRFSRKDGTAYEMPRPEISIARNAWNQMKGFMVEFGLTPAAASRVNVPTKGERSLSDLAADRANAVRSG